MDSYEIVNVIAPLLDFTRVEDLEKSVKNIFDKIPSFEEVKNIDNLEEYKKSAEMKKLNFEGLANFKYVEACCWLFNEIENMIRGMLFQKEKTITNHYMIFNDARYKSHISILAMTTNPDINTSIRDIQKEWVNNGYKLPFIFVKNIMKCKGYYIDVLSDKINPEKVKNKEIHSEENYEKPIEIFELILVSELPKKSGKIRERNS